MPRGGWPRTPERGPLRAVLQPRALAAPGAHLPKDGGACPTTAGGRAKRAYAHAAAGPAPQSSPYTLPAPCMHLGSECRVRPEALSQAPPSGRLASGAGPLTRSRPGGHATLLCHMPPPSLAQHTLPHHTGCTPGATTPPPGAHHHTTHGRPRGTGHHTRSKSRPNRPPPPAPPHDGAQWGTRLDVPRRAGESHADRCRRTREPHGALLARHSRRVAPSHQ